MDITTHFEDWQTQGPVPAPSIYFLPFYGHLESGDRKEACACLLEMSGLLMDMDYPQGEEMYARMVEDYRTAFGV